MLKVSFFIKIFIKLLKFVSDIISIIIRLLLGHKTFNDFPYFKKFFKIFKTFKFVLDFIRKSKFFLILSIVIKILASLNIIFSLVILFIFFDPNISFPNWIASFFLLSDEWQTIMVYIKKFFGKLITKLEEIVYGKPSNNEDIDLFDIPNIFFNDLKDDCNENSNYNLYLYTAILAFFIGASIGIYWNWDCFPNIITDSITVATSSFKKTITDSWIYGAIAGIFGSNPGTPDLPPINSPSTPSTPTNPAPIVLPSDLPAIPEISPDITPKGKPVSLPNEWADSSSVNRSIYKPSKDGLPVMNSRLEQEMDHYFPLPEDLDKK